MLERHPTRPHAGSHRTTYQEPANLVPRYHDFPRYHDLVTHTADELIPSDDGPWELRAPTRCGCLLTCR